MIDDFEDKRYNNNQIAERHIITIANKMDKWYDFYIKHSMHAVDWKVNAKLNKNKSLISKFNHIWRHSLSRKFECYRA